MHTAPQPRRIKTETAESHQRTSGRLLARNAGYNLATEGWLTLVLLATMPRIVHLLGNDGFGLFSLAWVIVGYLAVLDIGVTRATTKFVSEYLASREPGRVREIVQTSLTTNCLLGILGMAMAVAGAPYFVRWFNIPHAMLHDARLVLVAAAVAIPFLMVQGIARAALSSFQRFAAINVVNGAATTAQWVGAALLAWKGYGVVYVVAATVVARILATIAYLFLLTSDIPQLWASFRVHRHAFVVLFRFGAWVTISQIMTPLLVYIDRLFIGRFLTLAAVTVYTVPTEAFNRLRIIPASVVATLFPAFTEHGAMADGNQHLQALYAKAVRYLLYIIVPAFVLLLVFARDLLALWMSPAFAREAATIVQIMTVGFLLNFLAHLPYSALQALGRPDLPSKFYIFELPLYVISCLLLIPRFGLAGAATASTLRVSLDAVLLFAAAWKYCGLRLPWRLAPTLKLLLVTGLLLAATYGVSLLFASPWERLGAGVLVSIAYGCACWLFLLERVERGAFLAALIFNREAAASTAVS
jgi:O-antigen/teichoic acid export membrane protein